MISFFFFFFFQAEDGIRDHCVTGVQTCALPISFRVAATRSTSSRCGDAESGLRFSQTVAALYERRSRSEERRVGKSVDLGGRGIVEKKKERKKVGVT